MSRYKPAHNTTVYREQSVSVNSKISCTVGLAREFNIETDTVKHQVGDERAFLSRVDLCPGNGRTLGNADLNKQLTPRRSNPTLPRLRSHLSLALQPPKPFHPPQPQAFNLFCVFFLHAPL